MPKGTQPTGLGTGDSGASGGSGAATNSIVIDMSAMGGLAAGFWGDSDQAVALPQRRILVNDTNTNQLAQGFFNPWMRQGYLSPTVSTLSTMGYVSTPPTLALTSVEYDPAADTIYWGEGGVNASGGSGIFDAAPNGSIPSFNNTSATRVHTVGAALANVNIIDLQVYTLNGLRTLFYSFGWTASGVQKSGVGATDLTGTLSGSSFIDGWSAGTATYNGSDVTNPITTLKSAAPFLRLGSNGFMYIMDGSWIHLVDGTTIGGTAGTITANVFNISPVDYIVDAIAYRQLMYLACQSSVVDPRTAVGTGVNFRTDCYVTVWTETTVTTNPSTNIVTDIITIPGIKSIQKLYISPTDSLRMICIAANGLTQIREYNGTQFALVCELGVGASPQYADSLTVAENLTMWIANDGTLYGHGMVLGQSPEVLGKIGSIVAPGANNIFPQYNLPHTGAIIYGAATEFGGPTSGYRQDLQGVTISYLNPLNSFTSTAVKLYPFDKGTIQLVNGGPTTQQKALAGSVFTGVHFLESSTASFYTGTRFISQLSTVAFINIFHAAGNNNSLATTSATVNVYFNGSQTAWGSGFNITGLDINKGYRRLEINQPYVNTVQLEVTYNTVTTLSDTFDFHPYVAIVYYSPTNTRG
jgi:hypothetical protein